MQQQPPPPHYWFRAKRFGYGWTPASWQGWTLLAVWAAGFTALVIAVVAAAAASNAVAFGILLLASFAWTLALVWISYRHGEPPRWRWGNRS
jgi:hypothetical protein